MSIIVERGDKYDEKQLEKRINLINFKQFTKQTVIPCKCKSFERNFLCGRQKSV